MQNKGIITVVMIVVLIIIGLFFWNTQTGEETNTNTNTMTNSKDDIAVDDYMDIAVDAAYQLIQDEADLVILDVSPNFAKGHISGAVNYYIGDGSLDAAISTLDDTVPYLVYCHVDSAAIAGANALIKAGFPTVYRLVGNYSAWENAGYPISIPLTAVSIVTGDVQATVSFFNGTFTHALMADIPQPAEGKFYEGWLVQGTDFFSTGRLENIGGDEAVYYTLLYTNTEDQRAYNEVVVTEETESLGLDGNPETHIFEGTF